MECSVCLERYDSAERRPKILPCGHSFCLKCLLKLPSQKCPLDNQMFESSPEGLVDNFSLLQATDKPIEIGSRRFWCLSCAKVATEECVDEHSVCSLKKARGGEAAPLLEALRRGEAVLAKLRHTLDDAVRGLANDDGRGALQREQAGLAAARQRLQSALEADAAVWEQAKRAAMQSDWNQSAAASDASLQLLTDLADPATKCTVTVRRGADGEASWTGEVRPAEDAAAALLLCRLACRRALRQVARKPQEHTVVPAPRWRECSNELTVQEMASIMKWGSRVARGRDWEADWDFDGHPPEPGTVVEKCHGEVQVEWDHNGRCDWFNMGSEGLFHLRLLASVPLSPHLGTPGNYIDVEWFDLQAMTKLLSGTSLQKARSLTGLRCSVYPTWCKKVLGQVAPHLEGLQMVYPLQQHLDAALAMPHLQSLSITGVTGQQLRQVSFVASLRRLEIHCPPEDPLPLLSFSATKPGLRWLRSGVYPLVTALALMRAHADTLEELQLVAATAEPYGCPDLQREVRQCRLNKLKRLVLLRQTATDAMCRHRWNECKEQKEQLWKMFSECGLVVSVICSHCDKADFKN